MATNVTTTNARNGETEVRNDEVGWFFVEQYYTTLSKTPERLHLFYGKNSQFIYGKERQISQVYVGRTAIQQKIKELNFSGCKVRVNNVDPLPSFDNILIQVIGETLKEDDEEPHKFVQTFVLAQQPSGYFILNDIWRYIDDTVDETADSEADATATTTTATTTESEKPTEQAVEVAVAEPTTVVDEKAAEVDEKAAELDEKAAPAEEKAAPAEEAATTQEAAIAEEVVEKAPVAEEQKQLEAKEEVVAEKVAPVESEKAAPVPETTSEVSEKTSAPVAAAAAPAATTPAPTQTPAAAPAPRKAMTWASRAAAAGPKTSTGTTVAASSAAVPASAKPSAATGRGGNSAASTPNTSAAKPAAANLANGEHAHDDEWQTAGVDSKRQKAPQAPNGAVAPAADKEQPSTEAYIKYVTEKVQSNDLKAHLSRYGNIVYFDINRSKNCAFVQFATAEGYKAAAAANPHTVNGEQVSVEQRRPKAGGFGGPNFGNGGRGGANNRRGGSFEGGRGRGGNFGGRGRGGLNRNGPPKNAVAN